MVEFSLAKAVAWVQIPVGADFYFIIMLINKQSLFFIDNMGRINKYFIKNLIFILLFILLSILLFGCKNQTNNQSYPCPEEIIPERISINVGEVFKDLSGDYNKVMIESNFADGIPINMDYFIDEVLSFEAKHNLDKYFNNCYVGYQVGENKNWLYCFPALYSRTYEVISEEGSILKKEDINLKVEFVLKPEGNYFIDKEQGLFIEKEAWIKEKAFGYNIYANYSVVSATCTKIK